PVQGAVRALEPGVVDQRYAVAVREEPGRPAVPPGLRRDVLPQCLGEHDRLEGRGRGPGRGRVIEVATPEVAAVVGAYAAGRRVLRDERGVHAEGLAVQHRGDPVEGGPLGGGVERGDHAQTGRAQNLPGNAL